MALVAAVGSAAGSTANDTIDLTAGCTYTLTVPNNPTDGGNGLPLVLDAVVSGKLTINGHGATIERSSHPATPKFRIFEILAGSNVEIHGVTFLNGAAVPHANLSYGGGIVNVGTLLLTNVTFSNNSASDGYEGYGGAIYNTSGNLTINNGTFTNNSATGTVNGYGGAILSGGPVTATNITVSGNSVFGGTNGYGGGIFSNGPMTLTDSTVSGNTASATLYPWGGGIINGGDMTLLRTTVSGNTITGRMGLGIGIYNNFIMTLNDSTVSSNTASGELSFLGGGIHNSSTGVLNVNNSTISSNSIAGTVAWGGGIYNVSGTVTVSGSTISDNTTVANGAYGGGIFNDSGKGTVTVISSTITRNSVTGSVASGGAGLHNNATITVTNSVISDNTASGGENFGGGLYNSGTATLNNSTISGNSGINTGGMFTPGTLHLNNSLIANNIGGGDCVRPSGTVNARHSLIGEGLGCVNGTNNNNLTGDPALNGDLTPSGASKAINAGNNALIPAGITLDRVGNPRILDGIVDIGAFEGSAPPVPTLPPSGGGDNTPPSTISTTFLCNDLTEQTGGSIMGSGSIQNAAQGDQRGNTYCHVIALNGRILTSAAEIGNADILNLGVIQAIDVAGLLPNGVSTVSFASPVRLCLRGAGEVLFLNAATQRSVQRLPATAEGGYLCVDVPNAGTVVLVGSQSGQAEPVPPQSPVTELHEVCQVTTTDAPLNLRAEPDANAAILAKLPYDLTLAATARVPGWYRVIYEDGQGWVSDRYLSAVGACG